MDQDNGRAPQVPASVPAKYAFGYRLAQVVGKEPEYYNLLVADEPSRRMWDLVESLALEGDPDHPDTALQLFQEFSVGAVPQDQADRWLAGLRDAARNLYRNAPAADDEGMAAQMMRIIYSDPNLYELVAAAEPGYGLLELVESLALEGDPEDLESILGLIKQYSAD